MFELPSEHRPRQPPELDLEALPPTDRMRGRSVCEYLKALAASSLRYSEAVYATRICGALLIARRDEAEVLRNTAVTGWFGIAGEAAVLSARNYWKALEALDGLPGSIPAWLTAVDFAAFNAAKNDFKRRFPEVDRARHSIAHPEFYPNPDMGMMRDGQTVPNDRYNGFTAIFEGQLIRCEVTEEAAQFLAENAARVFAAFARLQRPATKDSEPQKHG
jgi:hypothetical protein